MVTACGPADYGGEALILLTDESPIGIRDSESGLRIPNDSRTPGLRLMESFPR